MASDGRWCTLHADASGPASLTLSRAQRLADLAAIDQAVGARLDSAAPCIETTAAM